MGFCSHENKKTLITGAVSDKRQGGKTMEKSFTIKSYEECIEDANVDEEPVDYDDLRAEVAPQWDDPWEN